MKFTKTHANRLRDYLAKCDTNGCLPLDEWLSGRYSRKTPRALPPFVGRYEKTGEKLPAPCGVFFADNPKRKAVYWLDYEKMFEFFGECARGCEFDNRL